MLDSEEYREPKNGRRYNASTERTMSGNGSIEEIVTENVDGEVSKIQTLTQEAINEQIKGFIDPLNRQLEELTRLVKEWWPHRVRSTTPGLTLVLLLVQPHISPIVTKKQPEDYRRLQFWSSYCSKVFEQDLANAL